MWAHTPLVWPLKTRAPKAISKDLMVPATYAGPLQSILGRRERLFMTADVTSAAPEAGFTVPFFFLRHGETTYNRDRRFQGQRDTDLSPRGRDQAAAAAAALADAPISRIVSSSLARARITAETVAAKHGLPVETDDALMECHLGIHQGEPYAEWMPDYWRGAYAPEGGETFWTFRDRVLPAMARAAAQPGTLIVAHGGLWYAARSLITMAPDIAVMPNCLPLHVSPREAHWDVEILGGANLERTVQGFGPSSDRPGA